MNKLATYFKQAWNLIKQEKLFSSIYILGTGLSITIVMVVSIVYYIRIANIYPETNRDRMLIVTTASVTTKKGNDVSTSTSISTSGLSFFLIETCLRSAESAEAVTAIRPGWEPYYIQPEGSHEQLPVIIKMVDTQFWKVFPFRFINGKPFTQADMQSDIYTAVIAESLAKRLFGTTDVTGRQISLNYSSCRICGVVKDVSYATERTFAQLWLPCGSYSGDEGLLGGMNAVILAPSPGKVEQVRQEILANVNRYSQTLENRELSLPGQPYRQWQSILQLNNNTPDYNKILLQYGLFFLVLLLVPAVGLSGMADSRMERRMAESGVRRAFGAPVRTLIRQIVTENFLFTILGGIAGLLLSYLIILLCRSWILQVGLPYQSSAPKGIDILFTPAMLLNLPVFAIALAICFILNLLAAIIPAWRYANREIVHSLNAK